ncbi:hypothetical protein PUN28_008895 [Cardiocondyla obscurior]|uniref:Uncharacterized protein n=1 Tax=Cardiocondyla obscurior TaxID=286306 RepID=A0AAW2FRI2_9HYME
MTGETLVNNTMWHSMLGQLIESAVRSKSGVRASYKAELIERVVRGDDDAAETLNDFEVVLTVQSVIGRESSD